MTSKLRACTKRPASSAWPSLKDGPRGTSTWFSAKHYEPERPMSVRAQTEKSGRATGKSAFPSRTDIVRPVPLVRFVPILLQKSKIRRSQKSRESRFRDIAVASRLRVADTKFLGRFGVKRYVPSHREAQDASAALKISVQHPKNTFATKSANKRHGGYSITSSARSRNEFEKFSPMAFAVLR